MKMPKNCHPENVVPNHQLQTWTRLARCFVQRTLELMTASKERMSVSSVASQQEKKQEHALLRKLVKTNVS